MCKKALHSRLKQVLNRFHLGKLTYLALTVQSLFTMETANAKVVTEHGGYILPKMIFAAAMNLPAEGGGVPMAPHASVQDGLLSLGRHPESPMADFFPASVSGCCKAGAY